MDIIVIISFILAIDCSKYVIILEILNRFALVEKLISPLGHWCVEVICEEINSFSFHMSISQKNHTVGFFGGILQISSRSNSEWFLRVLNLYLGAWIWLA